MSSSDYSRIGESRGDCWHGDARRCGGGHWSGANIAAMVIGFVLFPPLGLVVLVWTLFGRPIQELPSWLRDRWRQWFRTGEARPAGGSDNVVFDEYQQTQYDRIREIRDEIGRRAEAFRHFRSDAQRRRDRQEFDDFMASNPERNRT